MQYMLHLDGVWVAFLLPVDEADCTTIAETSYGLNAVFGRMDVLFIYFVLLIVVQEGDRLSITRY